MRSSRPSRWLVPAAVVVVAASIVGVALAAMPSQGAPAPPPASVGQTMNLHVPPAVTRLPLENQYGHPETLGSFAGAVTFVVPFLTSCQEECPITTGALLSMQQRIEADHLQHRVHIVEVTVDPGRDSPARMAAYAQLIGARWTMLTGSTDVIDQLWKYFGVYHQVVPEGSPPGIDWQTHRPYTYDVDHSNGFLVLGADLHERYLAGGMAQMPGLPAKLRRLLDAQGEDNLHHPASGSWTPDEALAVAGWLLGRPVA